MTEEEKIQLMADLVLWIANCPVKLKPLTVSGIITEIHLQILHEKLEKALKQ